MPIPLRPRTWLIVAGALLAVVIIGTLVYLVRPEERGISPDQVQAAPTTLASVTKPAANPAAEPTPLPERPPAPEGVDASGLYKNAFVLWDQLSEEDRQRLSSPHDGVHDEASEALFQKIQPIMALLYEASQADYCDWALGEINSETRLLYLPRAQALAKLALWNAAHRMPIDPDGAVADLIARAQLGRDISDTLIGFLVETSFEQGAAKLLQQHGATLTPSAMKEAHALFTSSEFEPNIRRAMQAETDLVNSFTKMSSDTLLKLVRDSTNPAVPEDTAAVERQRELERLLSDADLVQAEAKYLTDLYARLPDTMHWPKAQFESWWQGIEAELPARSLARMVLPSMMAVRSAAERSLVQRSMVAAGLAILQQGPAELAKYPDPYASGPFVYSATESGFELRSTLQHKGEPVRMEFLVPQR